MRDTAIRTVHKYPAESTVVTCPAMAHPKHLITAYDEAALQYREASAVLHRRIREGGVPTREDLERAAAAKETLEEAVLQLQFCGSSI